jgi:hypothetical protein
VRLACGSSRGTLYASNHVNNGTLTKEPNFLKRSADLRLGFWKSKGVPDKVVIEERNVLRLVGTRLY